MKWNSVKERIWNQYFEQAKEYYQKNGNLNVNIKYETDSGLKLGVWISSQRCAYSNNKLSSERITLLESVGMCWQRDISRWEEGYLQAEEYYKNCSNLNPIAEYLSEDGFPLGRWIASQRNKYQKGKLSDIRISELEKLGMNWNPHEALWQEGYRNAKLYFKANGNLCIKSFYITDDGYKLGAWLNNQRTKYKSGKLSNDRIAKLEKIGMIWDKNEAKWQENYNCALLYFKQNQDLSITQDYVTKDGCKLGSWVATQRRNYKKGILDTEKQTQLENIGAVFQQ